MSGIVASVRRVTEVIEEIAAASEEQTGHIDHINRPLAGMDTVTRENAGPVAEASVACQELQQQAALLSKAVSVFRLDGQQARLRPPAARPALGRADRLPLLEHG